MIYDDRQITMIRNILYVAGSPYRAHCGGVFL